MEANMNKWFAATVLALILVLPDGGAIAGSSRLGAMTNSEGYRESAVMMSSAIPSAKNSCSGSGLMLVNGGTAMDKLAV
jgi:hypothetical protein